MASTPAHYLTPEEYLERERVADQKHEYFEGQMILMAGGRAIHAGVSANVVAALSAALRGKNCFVFNSDLRVSVHWEKLITYPDAFVVCGTLEFADDQQDTVTNPTLVVEVLSPSTTSHDRGAKLRYYRQVPSLREYLLVDPEPTDIEHGWQLENGHWEIEQITDREAIMNLRSLNVPLSVADIYRNAELFRRKL